MKRREEKEANENEKNKYNIRREEARKPKGRKL